MTSRSIDRITTIPPLGPGFGGDRHRATLVVAPGELPRTDPFFLMADDHITAEGRFGESHPHAGLETVTFMLNGTMEDTGGRLEEGDVEWMTAGSGIVHSENAVVSTGMRLFQLWMILPEAERNIAPRVQILRRHSMPTHIDAGVVARVYSGRMADAVAPTLNVVPTTLVDVRLDPGATFEADLPASYNAFVVGIQGDFKAGDSESLGTNSVGWTGPKGSGHSSLKLHAGMSGARLLLYAGQPQNISVVAQGPFIAGSRQELAGYFSAYQRGLFAHAGKMRPADALI